MTLQLPTAPGPLSATSWMVDDESLADWLSCVEEDDPSERDAYFRRLARR
ncbi:MAG: hypothetical protein U0939_04895 [Pirellulales bacterium]